MTSINVMRLDFHSGLLVCDEARYWNPEWMIFYTPEKIRSIVREDIARELKLVMFMGQTGTSSIGDEWIEEVRRDVSIKYDNFKASAGTAQDKFMDIEEIAQFAFQTMTKIKHRHLDDYLVGRYGFTRSSLIQGGYLGKSGEVEIKDKDLLKQASKYLNFENASDEVKGIYGNSQIFGGYSPREGFRIFYATERWPVCEEIQEIFLAQGSGRDTCDLQYAKFADSCALKLRKSYQTIPRAVGLIALLKGLNMAFRLTAGVGGYPKIIYIDGRQSDIQNWVKEISDCRSKLAAEMVAAEEENLLEDDFLIELIESLIFLEKPFHEVNADFFRRSRNPERLFKFLRNYSIQK